MKSECVPVAIVGGGFSGTIIAAELARRGIGSVLIDGSGRVGKGVAYSTTEPAHLLNVRAEGMSAWADDPDHFARLVEAEGGGRRDFIPRRRFGRYLGEILEQAQRAGVHVAAASVTEANRGDDRWCITLDTGDRLEANALVLAIGNQEPEGLGAFSSARRRFIRNPWGAAARAAVSEVAKHGGDAMLIGTGLTMVDLVLSLNAAGHRGRIVALSRRGQLPRAHADFDPAAVEEHEVPSGDLRALSRWLRRRAAQVGWRAAVDSLRPHSHRLWQALSPEQQRRFLRHARPWWDVHRHRIAPEVAQTIASLIAEGRLEVVAGRVISASETEDAIEVELRRRGSRDPSSRRFAYAFNCTGPLHAIGRTRDPLLRSLLDAGFVKPDHLNIGIEVDDRSRAIGGEHLWALGPLTKGRHWEIIAVPDIRDQAAAAANDIAAELRR
jgi:uncharacterized NAD(P)/FAD-binding protein YdhS